MVGTKNVQELLGLYVDIIDTLQKNQYVRTRNSPIGDLAEFIVLKASFIDDEISNEDLSKKLEQNSNKSFDLIDSDGKKVQVKSRVAQKLKNKTGYQSSAFSAFRGDHDFDYCIFLVFDAEDYSLGWAGKLDREKLEVEGVLNRNKHTNGDTITISKVRNMCEDITEKMQKSYKELRVDEKDLDFKFLRDVSAAL